MDKDTSVAVESLLKMGSVSPSSPDTSNASSPGCVNSPPPSPTESINTDCLDERLLTTPTNPYLLTNTSKTQIVDMSSLFLQQMMINNLSGNCLFPTTVAASLLYPSVYGPTLSSAPLLCRNMLSSQMSSLSSVTLPSSALSPSKTTVPILPKVASSPQEEECTDRPKPFVCPHEKCGKTYYKNSHLKAHIRIHTGKHWTYTVKDIQSPNVSKHSISVSSN